MFKDGDIISFSGSLLRIIDSWSIDGLGLYHCRNMTNNAFFSIDKTSLEERGILIKDLTQLEKLFYGVK